VKFDQKVLLVDDVPTMRSIVSGMLRELGFSAITELSDGSIAWELLQHESFDLLVVDWNMPELSGVDLVKKIRLDSRLQSLPILLMTSRNSSMDVREAKLAGVSAYLVKPFGPQELLDCLGDLYSTQG
jgi:two-component system chemotaxis response regulator CheY